MRTSKISQETTRIFSALSPNARKSRRTTRSVGKGIATYALGYDGSVEVKEEELDGQEEESPALSATDDIEDIASPVRTSRKRKYGKETPLVTTSVVKTEHESTWISPRKQIKKEEDEANEDAIRTDKDGSPTTSRSKAKPKTPARRTTSPGGTTRIQAPSNWEEIYTIIREMRRRNPTAPVDTMGCEDLFWQSASPKEKRYHTLTALMLSSQTKDTVTAAAMQRLHTELVPQSAPISDDASKLPPSTLTVANIISATPVHLDSLISKVGFHNNKTKYIQQTAALLRAEYDSDIPSTVEGLMRLPGVGPKMAYLCMSAAWGIDLGIGVDVHVHRITNLWGWHTTKTPEETRAWLEGWLPRDKWHEINKMLVGLGQTVCLPVGRRCGECDLAGKGLCKSEIRGWKAKVKRERVVVQVKNDDDEKEDAGKVVIKEQPVEDSVVVKEQLVES